MKYEDVRLLGTVNRARWTQIATDHVNDITKELHANLSKNKEAFSGITETKWTVEDAQEEWRVAEENMTKHY